MFCHYNYGTNSLWSWGGGMLMMLFWVIIIGVIIYFMTKKSNVTSGYDNALELLRERFVKGEISEDEFNNMKKKLK